MLEDFHSDATVYRKLFEKNIVTVTGMTRSGKSILAPMVCSLKGSEKMFIDHVFEQYPFLHGIGRMSDEIAIYLLRYSFDMMTYDNMIGRNSNLRFGDLSSIWNTVNPEKYFKRLNSPDRDVAFEQIEKDKPLFVFMLHNSLMHGDILFKAFPSLKMLQMERHPADLVHSWYLKRYGGDFYTTPRCANLTIKWEENILPYYAAGWEKEYIELPEMDRVIQLITRLIKKHEEGYVSLSSKYKKQVMKVPFEGLVAEPVTTLEKICNFLGKEETLYTPLVIQKEQDRNPRRLNKQDRIDKRDAIKKLSSESAYSLLEDVINKYESEYGVY